ncbi:hypothetical protein [Stratiformator vulcanicus]|uniref:Secreted protein n=1 Tax=Stratiformator vulcanicus TaxID=2527980 RepID=A0A517QY40_9PLAN|nr:hypothetical protein [Stratiformator vulcanicus]QDT36513.1 hypothetical protein Pan189_08710 [Stratiformator vulcanicus]
MNLPRVFLTSVAMLSLGLTTATAQTYIGGATSDETPLRNTPEPVSPDDARNFETVELQDRVDQRALADKAPIDRDDEGDVDLNDDVGPYPDAELDIEPLDRDGLLDRNDARRRVGGAFDGRAEYDSDPIDPVAGYDGDDLDGVRDELIDPVGPLGDDLTATEDALRRSYLSNRAGSRLDDRYLLPNMIDRNQYAADYEERLGPEEVERNAAPMTRREHASMAQSHLDIALFHMLRAGDNKLARRIMDAMRADRKADQQQSADNNDDRRGTVSSDAPNRRETLRPVTPPNRAGRDAELENSAEAVDEIVDEAARRNGLDDLVD